MSLGAGAAVGIVATAPVSVPLAVVGAVVGAAVGLGTRLAIALPRNSDGPRIDPFTVNEPWRHAVIDAIRAKSRFDQAVKSFKAGPLREAVGSVGSRFDEAVNECWRVAQQGQLVADARKAINDREVTWELEQARQAISAEDPSDVKSRRIASLQAQLETAARMDRLVESTRDQLDLLNARLDESVTRAIELSVSNRQSGVGGLGDDVESIVDDLTSLRLAIEDVEGRGSDPVARTDPAHPGGEANPASRPRNTGQTGQSAQGS